MGQFLACARGMMPVMLYQTGYSTSTKRAPKDSVP